MNMLYSPVEKSSRKGYEKSLVVVVIFFISLY